MSIARYEFYDNIGSMYELCSCMIVALSWTSYAHTQLYHDPYGQVRWVLGGSGGSVWVMGEWSVGQWIVGRDDFFKTFRRTRFRVSVTKRNFPVCMEDFHHVSHTPHQYHPCDRIFGYMPKCDFSSFSLITLQQWLIYMLKSSSVTKRNIMVGMVQCSGMVYTPHQCWYSDRKSLYWEKGPKVPKCAQRTLITMRNTLPSW